jgi:hypothetical protein
MKFNDLRKFFWISWLTLSVPGLVLTGCEKRSTWGDSDTAAVPEEQMKLLLPAKIDILPFTKPRSWDDDQIPDGIEVVLRPLDSFGDQTKAIGCFRFELYTYQKANSEVKGRRIGFWEESLTTRESQYLHWDKITRTYRFRLAWNSGQKPRPGKYVLEATYLAPSGLRLTDTYILEARVPKEQYKENIENKQKSPFKLF